MGPPIGYDSFTGHIDTDLIWPFGILDGLDSDDIREAAYEIFFTACRSSPGFGGRTTLTFHSKDNENGDGIGTPTRGNNRVGMAPTSRIKNALGLKMLNRSPSTRMTGGYGSAPATPSGHGVTANMNNSSSPGRPIIGFTVPASRARRPLTSAEIMRQQMRVTEQSDNRLRKTLMRTLVGQISRRAETIILPLELLRHLKPSEFSDAHEYHLWQKRQLKILEAGLLINPSIPLEKSNPFAIRLREIINASESKPIDTGKNSDTMRALCNSIISLAWRSPNGCPTGTCHWADGFPLNVHIYLALLQSIFDTKVDTLILDEVDELLELMKKTWSTLGINRQIHNVCFTWILFQQFVMSTQTEAELVTASLAMLSEIGNDAKKADREAVYVKLLSGVLGSMQVWSERKLMDYHDNFDRGTVCLIENLLPLALSASNVLGEDLMIIGALKEQKGDTTVVDVSGDRVDGYIRSSVKRAFAKIMESGNFQTSMEAKEERSKALIQLAKESEDLALKERESFSPILKKWHQNAAGVAAVTLHKCYGLMLNQYLAESSKLSIETVEVLQRAGKLERVLVQMVVEDTADCEDGGKNIVREMVPFEVDSVILGLLRQWIDDRLKKVKDCVQRVKETEIWNPKSKTEPHAQSAVELVKLAKGTVDDFFEIPIGITNDFVDDLADGLERIFRDYINFVASCGSKQSYVPALPPLTRCNRASKIVKLWRKARPFSIGVEEMHHNGVNQGHHPRPSTSKGTQRLYIRLNTLHYLQSHLHSLDKTLSLSPRIIPSTRPRYSTSRRRHGSSSAYFDFASSAIQSACQHVSEVAAYRLIFLDSNSVFYETLYAGDVADTRIRPVLRILKQNLTLLSAIITDRAQPIAMKEVMKASFEAYLMVLLAGGSSRVFHRSDHQMIAEDFDSLKRVFCSCGEGLIAENVVEAEADTVEGVVAMMGQCTEQLMEDFSIVACETSGIGIVGVGQRLPMPPTTGRWHRSDPNTILRVLCHRDDRAANLFLKRTFQLAKRR